jgi:holin-like protein
MLNALAILLVCQLMGEVLARAVALPVPGPVVGMALLLFALAIRRSIPAELHDTAQGLLRHLSLLFVPAGVGVMLHLARIRSEWLAIIAALLISSLLTLAVTALVFRLVARAVDAGDEEPS